MTRRFSLLSVLAAAVAIGGSTMACGVTSDLPPSTGSVDLGFIGVGDFDIDRIDYTISGNGITPIQGSISLTDAHATPSAIVGGLPAGQQASCASRATMSMDGKANCYGAASFDVTPGEASNVTITLLCSYPTTVRTIMVNGMTDYCPALSSYAAAPDTGFVGGAPISLTATAFSYYSDPPMFEWQARRAKTSRRPAPRSRPTFAPSQDGRR